MSQLSFVIMAGGKGVRMGSSTPKPLREIAGTSMLERVVSAARDLPAEKVIVVAGSVAVKTEAARLGCETAWQDDPLGTADALAKALPFCFDEGEVIVTCADVPLITSGIFRELYKKNSCEKSYITLLTAEAPDPSGYGRVIRSSGSVVRIVEEKEASPEEKAVKVINSGVYCMKRRGLERYLSKVERSPVKGEYYLTDLVHIAIEAGERVGETGCDWRLVQGVNTPEQLLAAEQLLKA